VADAASADAAITLAVLRDSAPAIASPVAARLRDTSFASDAADELPVAPSAFPVTFVTAPAIVSITAVNAALADLIVDSAAAHVSPTAASTFAVRLTIEPVHGSYNNLTFAANSTTCGVQGNYILSREAGSQSATWTIGNLAWVSCIVALRVTPQTSTLSATASTMSASLARGARKVLAAVPARVNYEDERPEFTEAVDQILYPHLKLDDPSYHGPTSR
jgi:hypothetical protein